MKSNIKKKLGYSIFMMLLVLMTVSSGQALINATRTIENNTLTLENGTNVTVIIQNDDTLQPVSLQEIIPSGWILTNISDENSIFKADTNEWIWLEVAANEVKTIKYNIMVSQDSQLGEYNINGNILVNETNILVTGDKTITLTNTPIQPLQPFEFTVDTSFNTINIGQTAIYILNITNHDNIVDTYNLITDICPCDEFLNANLSENNITVEPNNNSIVTLDVNSSIPGTYIVNVTATSRTNTSNTISVTTITKVTNEPIDISHAAGLSANPITTIVNVGKDAIYDIIVSNNGNTSEIYDLNTTTTCQCDSGSVNINLDKSIVSIEPYNSTKVILTVNGAVTGTYTVNVIATSLTDNSSSNVTTTTTITDIKPVLSINNFTAIPSNAISKDNPSIISADITKGLYNITLVEFGLIDSNNLILIVDRNYSGVDGHYNTISSWNGDYAIIGNSIISNTTTVFISSDIINYNIIRGEFNSNITGISNISDNIQALLWFNRSTGNLSNVTTPSIDGAVPLDIIEGNSTFSTFIYRYNVSNNGIIQEPGNTFTLYNITGNLSMNNPNITLSPAPTGIYTIYSMVNDNNNTSVSQRISVDTIPVYTSYYSSEGGGSSEGTYPIITAKPTPNATIDETSAPSITETVQPVITSTVPLTTPEEPVSTETKVPSEVPVKDSPGIGIIEVIGVISGIYAIVRKRL